MSNFSHHRNDRNVNPIYEELSHRHLAFKLGTLNCYTTTLQSINVGVVAGIAVLKKKWTRLLSHIISLLYFVFLRLQT